MPWSASTPASRADSPSGLLRFVEPEVQDREARAAERWGAAARFPVVETLDPFGFAVQPAINPGLVHEQRQTTTLRLDGREHPPGVRVAQAGVAAYGALLAPGRMR